MAKYVFPAIFTKEVEGGYSIVFPDVEGAFTQGEDMLDGVTMANDALCLMLYQLELEGKSIPTPSEPLDLKLKSNEFVALIDCDTLEYRKFYDNKAVKKTLSVPAWLNTRAEAEGINFSQTLQKALMEQLHIN